MEKIQKCWAKHQFKNIMHRKIIVYEKPTWTTCRKLATAFRENGVEFEQVNYFIDEMTEDKLRDLLKKADLEPQAILRKRERVYKEMNLAEETDPDKLIKIIVENPGLLERPIVEVGNKAVVARPIEKAIELINS